MCNECGCSDSGGHTETKRLVVGQSLLQTHDKAARENRERFTREGILAVNLISAPGSGKTSLLEKTAELLGEEMNLAVLEGDIETELDAERVRRRGVPAVQLTTGGACHLDPLLIRRGYLALAHELDGKKPDVMFIENVGNLVCPSFFELGEHVRVTLVSVPEGPDKPLKYPRAFRTSHVFIITKSDLLPHFDFDIGKVKQDALALNPSLAVFVTSAKTGEGFNEWIGYLRRSRSGR